MEPELYTRFLEIEDDFWWSVGTRRVFFDLVNASRAAPGGRALDVGCGTGITMSEFPREWALVAGCDRSDLALSACRVRGVETLVRADAARLPFASGTFDLVMALDVIEHVDDDAICLREIVRACRSGGCVLLHVPAFPVLWTEKDDLSHHRRRYTRRELLALVDQCGLSVERVFFLNGFLFPVALGRALWERLWSGRARPASRGTERIDRLYRIPAPLNRLLLALMHLERRAFARHSPPFGMSLVCLARKPAGREEPAAT